MAKFFAGVLLALALFSNPLLAGEAVKEVTLETESGETFSALVAGPDDAKAGILMVHDWFGVSPQYKETLERLAGEGYRVVAIDYYNGEAATTHQEAWSLMQKAVPEAISEKVKAGLKALKAEGRKVATFGFSLGTEYAYRAALGDPEVDGVVLWYGFSPDKAEDVEGLNADVLNILGSLDGPAADQGALYSKVMDEAGKRGELFIYPQAHHAFAQPLFNAGATYDPEGAEVAWLITRDFLARKLSQGD